MSKSTSMLPSLAGGSGVAAHALVDADLMKVVDAVTLNADRDRKVTLAELWAYMNARLKVDTIVIPGDVSISWEGSTLNMSLQSQIKLRRTSDGLWTLFFEMTTPPPNVVWTVDGEAYILVGPALTSDPVWNNFYDFLGVGVYMAPSPVIGDVHTNLTYVRSGEGFVGAEITQMNNASKQIQLRIKRAKDYTFAKWSHIAPANTELCKLVFEYTLKAFDTV